MNDTISAPTMSSSVSSIGSGGGISTIPSPARQPSITIPKIGNFSENFEDFEAHMNTQTPKQTGEFGVSVKTPKPASPFNMSPVKDRTDFQTSVSKPDTSDDLFDSEPEIKIEKPQGFEWPEMDEPTHETRSEQLPRLDEVREELQLYNPRVESVQTNDPNTILKIEPEESTPKLNSDRHSRKRYEFIHDRKKGERAEFKRHTEEQKNKPHIWNLITKREHKVKDRPIQSDVSSANHIVDQATHFLRNASLKDFKEVQDQAQAEKEENKQAKYVVQVKDLRKTEAKPEIQPVGQIQSSESLSRVEVKSAEASLTEAAPEITHQTEAATIEIASTANDATVQKAEATAAIVETIMEKMADTTAASEPVITEKAQAVLETELAAEIKSENITVTTQQPALRAVEQPQEEQQEELEIDNAVFVPDKMANTIRFDRVRQAFRKLFTQKKSEPVSGQTLIEELPPISMYDEAASASTRGLRPDKSYQKMRDTIAQHKTFHSEYDVEKEMKAIEQDTPALELVPADVARQDIQGAYEIRAVHGEQTLFPSWLRNKQVEVLLFQRPTQKTHTKDVFTRIRRKK